MEKGRAEGIAERNAEVARSMLADGMDPGLVSKYTGLTEDEICSLRE